MSMYISFQFLQQGRSQTSEKDEASLERRRREPLGWGQKAKIKTRQPHASYGSALALHEA